jgi:hypothetical protein
MINAKNRKTYLLNIGFYLICESLCKSVLSVVKNNDSPRITPIYNSLSPTGKWNLYSTFNIQNSKFLPLTLYWRAVTSPEPLTRFVQLIGPDGRIYGQEDASPDQGNYPTGLWQPGEIVVETINLPVETGRPAGRYILHVGLYRPGPGERLALAGGGDHVELPLPGW